ncbi:LUD domain-containing protein [Chitinophagales bacterium]|nr:LUD domain-containing protein [Chitinophagales bacterium]
MATFSNNKEIILLPAKEQATLQSQLIRLRHAVSQASSNYRHIHQLRKKAKNIRWDGIEHMDKYLLEFERQFTAAGGTIIWAQSAEEARNAVRSIRMENNGGTTVLARSAELTEIEIENFLSDLSLPYAFSESGQDLAKAAKIKSRHHVFSLLGKGEKQVRAKMDLGKTTTDKSAQELLNKRIPSLWEAGEKADLFISGVDFLFADKGLACLMDTEGAHSWGESQCEQHIMIAGIDRVVSQLKHLPSLQTVHSIFQYGEPNSAHTLLLGGKSAKKRTLIFLDNGRTDLLADSVFRESLYDLEGSSFVLDCPVYANVDAAHYHPLLPGPLGTLLTQLLYRESPFAKQPFLNSFQKDQHSNPYLINLHRMMVRARSNSRNKSGQSTLEKYFWKSWTKAMQDRKKLDSSGARIKNLLHRRVIGRLLGSTDRAPHFAPRSFAQLWEERR